MGVERRINPSERVSGHLSLKSKDVRTDAFATSCPILSFPGAQGYSSAKMAATVSSGVPVGGSEGDAKSGLYYPLEDGLGA